MEYVYAAMLIHRTGKKIDEPTLKRVLEAAGVKPDEARVKAVVAALEGVDIDKVIKEASVAQPVVQAPVAEKKPEEKKPAEEEKKAEEQAAAGLAALFG